ncbi:MAG: Ig-like domain-containing protein, partial [Syntrophales bacterium]|nr:Ig-like domain-containing protein [Syntrophales bacterium]
GAKYWVTDNIALRVDLRDYMVTEIMQDTYHNIGATIGITFAFGGVSVQADRRPAETAAVVAADTTAPTVIYTSPEGGATGVAIDRDINATFSEPMDRSTLTTSTFTVKRGTTPVTGKVTFADKTATFTPTTKGSTDTLYTATITTGAKDRAGNALASNYVWSFTTGLAADTTAPTVTFTSPVNGATAAPVNQKVNAAFSEKMNPATITAATFTVKQGTTPVSGKVTSGASTAMFAPAKNFENGKAYTATITTGAKDRAGNAMASNYAWNFTAFAPPKGVPVVLATLSDSHFAFDSSEITEDGKTILNLNITTMQDNPKIKIHIAGYTSASGSEEYNQKLSERRAAAVKEYLVKEGGINGNRITTIGYGEKRPARYEAVPSDIKSDAAHANMRVIVEIIEE